MVNATMQNHEILVRKHIKKNQKNSNIPTLIQNREVDYDAKKKIVNLMIYLWVKQK